MPLRIYNSLTQQKEEFKPLNPPEVKMYVCGPTVYDEPHIGHLRSAYVFEVIRNWLEYSGYNVQFVRNVTDVDDKIIDKARQEKASDLKAAASAVSSRYFDLYKKDLAALGIREPSVEPRATTHIAKMQELIGALIQKGFAYHVAGSSDVYFEVKKFAQYGKLSKQKTDEMLEHTRGETAPGKRDPLDFALWKGAKPDEPSWDSPWGPGRPGWHIECSAMSMEYLGESFDIHGGGLDLKFPHHENEIAQSESATGKLFAKYWIHHGLITVSEQKMSKSLKNFITLKSLPEMMSPAIKTVFLSTHYRSPLNYSTEAMTEAYAQRFRFTNFFRDSAKSAPGSNWRFEFPGAESAFREAMDDDFNTPKALAAMHQLVDEARKAGSSQAMGSARLLLEKWGNVLVSFLSNLNENLAASKDAAIDKKIKLRSEAKKNNDFKTADSIRKELLAQGIEIRDLSDGTTEWWPKK